MSHPADGGKESARPDRESKPRAGFRVANVLMLVTPLALLVVAAFIFVTRFDGLNWIASLMNPPLVVAQGRVTYQGEPLADAQITTQHANGNLTGSIGWTDEDGRFSLQTDMDGYVEGAFAGEHLVVVTAYETINAPASPPLLTPETYASFETTPLKVLITGNAQENEFELTLKGEPPARPQREGGDPGGRPGNVDPAGREESGGEEANQENAESESAAESDDLPPTTGDSESDDSTSETAATDNSPG